MLNAHQRRSGEIREKLLKRALITIVANRGGNMLVPKIRDAAKAAFAGEVEQAVSAQRLGDFIADLIDGD